MPTLQKLTYSQNLLKARFFSVFLGFRGIWWHCKYCYTLQKLLFMVILCKVCNIRRCVHNCEWLTSGAFWLCVWLALVAWCWCGSVGVRGLCALLGALCEAVRLGSRFGGCASPLGWLCGLIFRLVLDFWLLVGVLVRVKGVKSIISDF